MIQAPEGEGIVKAGRTAGEVEKAAVGFEQALGAVKKVAAANHKELEDARAGDFLDFSRNNKTGHSVIFIDWVRDDGGKITGFKYFSSNSTGVGYATEHFVDGGVADARDSAAIEGTTKDSSPDEKLRPARPAASM